jgi:hypothetical protein
MLSFTAIITLHLYSKFSEEETARNSFGPSYIYVHSSTTLSQRILQAQAAAAAAENSTSNSSDKQSSTESAIVLHSNGTSSDSSGNSGVWLPAAEFQGFSGTIKPVKVCLLSCCTFSPASTPSINLNHCLYELAVQHCA